MSKNKLIWNIALFLLIAIVSIPIAYAQIIPAGSQLYFLLINAGIIFLVLFALQSFLIPQKPDKEKTAVWIIVLLASLLLAYLFGRSGFLWTEGQPLAAFFSIEVLVNAIIIGAVLYFILGLLKIGNLQSPEGKTGYGILIFLVALIFAVKIGNVWIWEQSVVKQFIDYLFSKEGILNPSPPAYRLWTFLITAALLTFFFKGYLLPGGAGGTDKVNLALAILIAATVARSGTNLQRIVVLGEMIFLIVLAKAMKDTTPSPKGLPLNWFASAFLVGWASAAMTYGTEYQGWLATFVGYPLWVMGLIQIDPTAVTRPTGTGWFGWIGKMGLGALLLLLIPLALLFVIFRGETRRRILTLGWQNLKKRLNAILKFTKLLRANPKGREPQIFQEHRLLLNVLANYTTRSEITYRYLKVVEQGIEVGNELAPMIGKFWDQQKLRQDLIAYRSGDGKVKTSEGDTPIGWNRLNLEVVDLVNRYFDLIFRTWLSANFRLKEPIGSLYKAEGTGLKALEALTARISRDIDASLKKYKLRAEAFGHHHVFNAYKYISVNMFNVTGEWYEHPQTFARSGAEFEYGPDYFKNEKLIGGGRIEEGIEVPIHEVNQYGEYVEDIWPQKDKVTGNIDPRKYKKPRKLKNPKDIIYHPHFIKFMTNIARDWDGLAQDIRYGLHHPKSRTFSAYEHAISRHIFPEDADERIQFTNAPTKRDEAIDMRALANPGLNVYWGRRWFYSDTLPPGPNTIPPENPYPNLSVLGVKHYLHHRIDLDMKDKEEQHRIMSIYPADTGVTRKEYEGKKVTAPIGGTLAEKTPPPKE